MAYISFQPHDHFNTKLYSGTGSSNAQTGIGFSPSFTWIKSRSNTYSHTLTDAVRGVTKHSSSNNNNAEYTSTTEITSFDSDGFTVGTDAGVNNNGSTFASWNWKAGTTSGISAGSQTITPSAYSINTTAGFGIYKWSRTGASTTDFFSHGLGATPTIAIQKRTDLAQDWYVNTTVIDGTNDNLHLNKTDAKEDDSTTVPTSTNYYPKSPETGDYITYLFTPKVGFSKFGSYTGNGNTDGVFIYTGFKPAWFLVKKSSASGEDWAIYDNKRNTFNEVDEALFPSATTAETNVGDGVDFCSNGVKIRDSGGELNTSGATYIFMAFAESPIVSSNGVPATAR